MALKDRIAKLNRWRLWLAVGALAFAGGIAFLTMGLLTHFEGGDTASTGGTTYAGRSFNIEDGPGPVAGTSYPIRPRIVTHRLIIDSLGVDAPVIELGMDSQNVPDVPLDAGDVAWYNFTAKPGEGGNAVLAGHLNWGGDPGVFADLADLQPGEIIRVEAEDGREFAYEVSENFTVESRDPDSRWVMAPRPADSLTLITCGGTWVPDPKDERIGGNYTDRVVVQAERVTPPARLRSHVGF